MDVRSLVELKKNPDIADFRPGDTLRVHCRVIEGDRERVQVFEGVVIRLRRGGINSNFTVRRISHGVGVERTFPLYSPLLQKVEVTRQGHVRRAKLYYLRERRGKAARIKAASRGRPLERVAVFPEEEEELMGQVAGEIPEETEEEGVAEEIPETAEEEEPPVEEISETAAEEERVDEETSEAAEDEKPEIDAISEEPEGAEEEKEEVQAD